MRPFCTASAAQERGAKRRAELERRPGPELHAERPCKTWSVIAYDEDAPGREPQADEATAAAARVGNGSMMWVLAFLSRERLFS